MEKILVAGLSLRKKHNWAWPQASQTTVWRRWQSLRGTKLMMKSSEVKPRGYQTFGLNMTGTHSWLIKWEMLNFKNWKLVNTILSGSAGNSEHRGDLLWLGRALPRHDEIHQEDQDGAGRGERSQVHSGQRRPGPGTSPVQGILQGKFEIIKLSCSQKEEIE